MVKNKSIAVIPDDYDLLMEIATHEELKVGQVAHRAIIHYFKEWNEA